MTLDEANSLKNSLGIEMKILEDAGHINTDSGYGEWPWAKDWVVQ
jgi:predicted alpha/beta hydrolase family esterase